MGRDDKRIVFINISYSKYEKNMLKNVKKCKNFVMVSFKCWKLREKIEKNWNLFFDVCMVLCWGVVIYLYKF